VSGAHTRSARSAGADDNRPTVPVPVQRSRRDARPSGVGWWQIPKSRGPSSAESARHRVPHPDGGRRSEPTPNRPGRGLALPWRSSQPKKPLTAPEQAARRRRRIRHALLGAAATVLLGPLLAFALGYLFLSVSDPDEAVSQQVALVSFADGSQLTRLVPEQGNRIKVSIEQVPVHVREAVLAAEDRSFYSNPGFDLTGILRAAWNQVRGGSGGGSTITQQYVKKTIVGDEQTLWRKYKEVVLAVKISQERTKDQILGDYLNAIYFGRGAYGIQSASQAYFGKNVQDLTPSEGAMLAGLIQSPSRWDPAVSPERAVARWNFVLDGMATQGWLDPATRQTLLFPPTVPRRAVAGGVPADSRGHVVSAVTAELKELGISEQDLAQEGLRITTTIDPQRQQQAVDAAHSTLAGQPGNLRSAMVAINPQTGGVLAYYGGDNGLGLDYAQVRRLAGSTFKPFVVLAALQQEQPVGLGETFDGKERSGLRNADGANCDRCDLKQAMTVSNNVVFNNLAKQVGPEAVAEAARSAGITAPLDDPNAGIALGNKEISTFELASAYATIAAGGIWHQPHLVASVVTADDRVLYEAATDGERRFPEKVARNVTEAMLGVATHDGLALPGRRPVAAKTGTVESRFEGENNDAWMAGFTPSLSTSVWMGTDRNSPIRTARGTPINGSSLPGTAWQDFMSEALEDEPVEEFAPFQPIGDAPSAVGPDAQPTVTPTPSPAPVAPPDPGGEPVPPPPGAPVPPPAGPEAGAAAAPGGPPAPEPAPEVAPAEPAPAPSSNVFRQPSPSAATPAPDCSASRPCG